MGKLSAAEALQLSVPERIRLVEDIWDTIASVQNRSRSLPVNVKSLIAAWKIFGRTKRRVLLGTT
jgi:hypothetical protein